MTWKTFIIFRVTWKKTEKENNKYVLSGPGQAHAEDVKDVERKC